jgi:hypothetical protein
MGGINKMTKRDEIMQYIQAMRSVSISTLNLLIEENENGNQFDYCTSARLSEEFDKLQNTINKIDKIIYQK